jgi:DNA invertase Pin-like site-specific DNA recombinase
MGQTATDLVLNLLSLMVEEERTNIRTAQREGIEIAKSQGKLRGGKNVIMHEQPKKTNWHMKGLLGY